MIGVPSRALPGPITMITRTKATKTTPIFVLIANVVLIVTGAGGARDQ